VTDGFINIYKEEGLTSHAVVNQVRRIFGVRAIGHMGTLDPAARGVLPLAVGKATRLIPLVEGDTKVYRAELVLGRATDTYDTSGTTLATAEASSIAASAIGQVLPLFVGRQEQVPPMYSAIKVKGQKLYELARRGETIEVPPRIVHVQSIVLGELRREQSLSIAMLDITCSKGTYVRSLCYDIGRILHLPACMGRLWRERSGPFAAEDSVMLARLAEDPYRYLIPIDKLLAAFPRVDLCLPTAKQFVHGQRLAVVHGDVVECPVYCGPLFIGLGKVAAGILSPTKVMVQEVELLC